MVDKNSSVFPARSKNTEEILFEMLDMSLKEKRSFFTVLKIATYAEK
jgi:hypothetical protein